MEQPNFVRDVDEGRFYLPDAVEGKRETLVTTVIDAEPLQCLRVGGPTFLTFFAALFTGGFFIFATYHWWLAAIISGLIAIGVMLTWVWTGTAEIPEKATKDVGLGLSLPLYISGPNAVGWWAMFITMTADITAFVSLVFGYFFYWTIHEDFPPQPLQGPGVFWPVTGMVLLLIAYGLTLLSRYWNRSGQVSAFYLSLTLAAVVSLAGACALLSGPWLTGLDPTTHVYPAIVWVLTGWTVLHVILGGIMQLYCLARRGAGKMTNQWDADIVNVSLYWHFLALTVVMTVGVIAGFPSVS